MAHLNKGAEVEINLRDSNEHIVDFPAKNHDLVSSPILFIRNLW